MYKTILEHKYLRFVTYIFFVLVFLFARTFMGIYIFGFRIGEIAIVGSLLIFLISIFVYKKSEYFQNIKDYKIQTALILLFFSFLIMVYTSGGSFTNPYTFKSSSYIWTFGFFFFGLILFNKIEFKITYLYVFLISLLYIYFYSVFGIPENIQKVVEFMNETGGSLQDYVRLNTDYSSLDENQLLREYYQNTKPHLSTDEIDFLMEDQFSYDEETDEERDIKRKKLALKEQVANAKSHLDGLKSKYYEEIKAGSRLAPEQKKAVDFFNRYNKEQAEIKKVEERQVNVFNKETNKVFNDNFKGFEFNVGDKKYRYNVKNAEEVKQTQGNISNFVKKFLNKNNEMQDAAGYHKSLFTAMNPDAIANHFYNQGKADALKESIAKSKNVDMTPRQGHTEVKTGGTTYRVISGDDTRRLRVKMNRK